ncbi:uncharacterized protein METZ01_LOCUS207616, partial [marine metagenome]
YNGDRIGQGKKNACEFLSENQHLADDIERQIRAKLLDEEADEEADEPDNVTPITGS